MGTRLAASTVLLLRYGAGRTSKDHVKDGRRSEKLTKQAMYVYRNNEVHKWNIVAVEGQ
jgi:hypothetical protein